MTMAHEGNLILAYQAWLATVKATKRTALHAGRKLSNLPAVLKAYLYPKQLILPHKIACFRQEGHQQHQNHHFKPHLEGLWMKYGRTYA